ncbi:Bcr/CflA family multidrug efflux MFS transporter [Paraferrimonas sp. SM1919]|uniref:Bcr/CflA family multidrug efflux MFS transporter n=1 Tax=Paraferrimonas sp. SM1919 TaxID=2662263 RepID=UPI0013D3518F|nr:Bcr/CflA family multidrug efflux MFS transporter [Paraferrimonas sp. SM1919]
MSISQNKHFWLIFMVLGLLAGITPLAIDMYLPALPTIAQNLGTSTAEAQYTVSCYLIGFAIAQLFLGPIVDALGRLPLVAGGMLIFVISSALCASAESLEQLMIYRVLQAAGGASASVVVMAMLRDLFAASDLARAISMLMLVMTLAPLLAPIIGGYLLNHMGWRWIFYVLGFIALVCVLAVVFVIGETSDKDQRKPLSIAGAIAGYKTVLANRQCMGYSMVGVFATMALFCFITGSSFVYIDYFGVKPENFGYVFGLNILMMFVLTSFNARHVKRLGSHRLLLWAIRFSALAAVFLVVNASLDIGGLWGVVVPIVCMMGSLGVISANSSALAIGSVDGLAGSVAALGGSLRFALGASAGAILSATFPQTALPLAIGMASASWLSLLWITLFIKADNTLES